LQILRAARRELDDRYRVNVILSLLPAEKGDFPVLARASGAFQRGGWGVPRCRHSHPLFFGRIQTVQSLGLVRYRRGKQDFLVALDFCHREWEKSRRGGALGIHGVPIHFFATVYHRKRFLLETWCRCRRGGRHGLLLGDRGHGFKAGKVLILVI
jgi:hypothetical protein